MRTLDGITVSGIDARVWDPDGWCAPFVATLPVDHVAVSTMGDPFEIAVVAASDGTAAALTQVQLDRGAGPGWQAKATRSPVAVAHLSTGSTWSTLLSSSPAGRGIGSVYSLPLTVGDLAIGAVDLYAVAADAMSSADVQNARGLTGAVSLQVLLDAVQGRDDPDAPAAAGRRVVHQATGMVMAQLTVTADDALLLIRGYAFAEGGTVRDVAVAVVERRLTLAP